MLKVRALAVAQDVEQCPQVARVRVEPGLYVFPLYGNDAAIMACGQNLGWRFIRDECKGFQGLLAWL
jgi:hypothetical protein